MISWKESIGLGRTDQCFALAWLTKLFGNQSAVGKQLVFENGDKLTVEAYIKIFPGNSSVQTVFHQKMDPREISKNGETGIMNFYVRLDDPKNAEGLFENFAAHFDPPP